MMTPLQKFAAFDALDNEASIQYSEYTGKVYVTLPNVEICDGATLRSPPSHCDSFEETINQTWREWVTDLAPNEYLVKHAHSNEPRQHFRWNGFMWREMEI